jgi:glycosidase
MLINRASRIAYNFSLDFFRSDGHVVLGDLSAARAFAAQMSARRADPLPASDLYAISLLDEAYHLLIKHYYRTHSGVMARSIESLRQGLNSGYELTLARFIQEFPTLSVFTGGKSVDMHLSSAAAQASVIEEMLLINNANGNPALGLYKSLFDDSALKDSPYRTFMTRLFDHLASGPRLEDGDALRGETLPEILLAPITASPNSVEGQLRFIIEKWGHILGEAFSARLLRGIDYIHEEVIRGHGPHVFTSRAQVHVFTSRDYADYERFSPDRGWMPELVLLARNTYVWLHQLSRKYQRDIRTLNQIPNEELDLLAARGFTGLWLIGLWERSRASQRIKQRMGQSDAVASAYSLFSYDIAADLGGWEALNDLRARAWERRIRLSADMVPNHMGIDSTWVTEHPDWFLSIDHPPYPAYSFSSENLSDDPRVGIHLEDHYYDKSDAAVVFQRRDRQTGDVKYIYHGNDGTSFPWNDTAQLDYTKAEVREAVIQTILHVARNFPVIRFDAAMTLAKKHIQRLWFPEAGEGGAIPSRAQFGLTREQFDDLMPDEFWREVVDRVAAEVPDTLLLAEAFWLMEGYFVRTLGMHRVYNSAFMHMLRDEDNAKYRMAIKNTLEFDPQILKRYVNFMNNPDEKTAIEQFGSGDKYFGVATMLATLPGLPMFGHGQVEGYTEKYGMEFRRPNLDENIDEGLVRGHDWKIFPLLHRRYLFAEVEQFLLYDFFTASGRVDENVFAYSNMQNETRALVVYHNKFGDTRGWVKSSAAYKDKRSGDLRQKSLCEGLGIPYEGFVIFRDYVTNLEYIRSCEDLWFKGLYVELGAYQHHVFLDWRFVEDERWQEVHDALHGGGMGSIQQKWDEIFGNVRTEEVQKPEAKVKAAARRKSVEKKAPLKTGKTTSSTAKGKKPATRKPAVKKDTTSSARSTRRVKGRKPVKKTPAKSKKPVAKTKKSPATRKTSKPKKK